MLVLGIETDREAAGFGPMRLLVIEAAQEAVNEEVRPASAVEPSQIVEPTQESPSSLSGASLPKPEVADDSGANRLRPRLTNPALWRPPSVTVQPVARASARLFSGIDEINGRSTMGSPPDKEAFGPGRWEAENIK